MENWEEIIKFITETTTLVENELDSESLAAVKHYLDHSEYEMAFEGLFIEIMKLEKDIEIDFRKAVKLARVMRLDKESVFEPDFYKELNTHSIG